jgi:solute carrier family 25 S-adenosylmethionine transporter 26
MTLFPIDTLKTRLQVRRPPSCSIANAHSAPSSLLTDMSAQSPHGFKRAGGFRGLYNGVFAAAAGSAPAAALFFSTYESVKSDLTARTDPAYHPACYMASSACGEVAACWIRVPTENIKQKMQAGMYEKTSDCLRAIAKTGRVGYSGFYRGYTGNAMLF